VIPKGITRSRAFRFNVARSPATETRPSRGPWLAVGLYCPDRSSLTTASSAPLNSSPPLMDSRRSLLHPRKSALGGNPEVPQFTPLDWTRVPPPLPRWPRRVLMTIASSSVLAFTYDGQVRQPHWTFRGCRVHSELIRFRAHVTARELASPPFEDVYIRACTNPGHPGSASNMTTWVNSQFPRPDFHRQVQRHYGLHPSFRPLFVPSSSGQGCGSTWSW
jgi:hypothetical protein